LRVLLVEDDIALSEAVCGYLRAKAFVVDAVPSLAQARAVSDGIKAVLAARHGIAHVTVEAECEPCAPGQDDPCGLARPRGSAITTGDSEHSGS